MGLSDLCNDFISTASIRDASERNIIEFAEAPWGLGMGVSADTPPLFPVQKFILKCSYNIPLDNSEKNIIIKDRFNEKERFRFTEIEYLKFLQDENRINIDTVTGDPSHVRPNTILVIGRRGCKTSTVAVIASFEIYKLLRKFSPQQYYRMMPEDEIWVVCISPGKEQSSDTFRRITGHLERSDFFSRFRNKPTLGYMQLSTERDLEKYGPGKRPSIRIMASPCNSSTVRGHNAIIVILDEFAHFFEDESSRDKSDDAVYTAVTPSIAKFNGPLGDIQGKVICISSPNIRSGKFYELYQTALEKECDDTLMIQAPTWEVDYTLSSKSMRGFYVANPITFKSEFGGEFSDRISSWLENEQILRMNIVPGLRLKTHTYGAREPYFMGVDVALQNDGTAIAIVHVVRNATDNGPKEFIELDFIEARYASEEMKEFFRPEEIAEWIVKCSEKFPIIKGTMDQEYGLSIVPVLHDKGLKQFQVDRATAQTNSLMFQNLMSKMLDGALRIPEAGDGKDIALVTELTKLRATQHSKFLISVEAPQIKGIHDDMSDAFARAVYLATDYINKKGSTTRATLVQGQGPAISYKRHYRNAKVAASYTNRPSSTMMGDMVRNRHAGGLNRLFGLGR